MWQKASKMRKSRYHLISRVERGTTYTACGEALETSPELRRDNPSDVYEQMCNTCRAIWSLVFTSVEDCRATLRNESDSDVICGALDLARRIKSPKGMIEALQAKWRKMEKAR